MARSGTLGKYGKRGKRLAGQPEHDPKHQHCQRHVSVQTSKRRVIGVARQADIKLTTGNLPKGQAAGGARGS